MNDRSRVLAVVLLVGAAGSLGWMLTPSEGEGRQGSPAPIGASNAAANPNSPVELAAGPASEDQLAQAAPRAQARSAATDERRTTPDQMELRQAIAAAETRRLEAVEAAFEALRESRRAGCIEGWRDATGEVVLDAPAPPLPHLVRVYDLPPESGADVPASPPDPTGKGASQGPARVRVLAVHLTQANAPEVYALQAEAERLRRGLR
jgi:hypothetical protein